MKDTVNVEISQDLIQPIIQQKIQGAILEALGNSKEDIVSKLIEKVSTLKVNEKGTVDKYSSDNKYNWLDIVFQDAVKESIKKAISEWMENNKKSLMDKVKAYLSKHPSKMAKVLVEGFTESIDSYYRFSIKMDFEKNRD